MLKASFQKHTLVFKRPSGTSRGVLTTKDSWFLKVWDAADPEVFGLGECSVIYGLNPEQPGEIETKLKDVIENINNRPEIDPARFPSVRFALEAALLDLKNGGKRLLFRSDFTERQKPIPINGLVWMGEYDFMRKQIIEKVESGFNCIKLKIGAIDFDKELELLRLVRNDFKEKELELRVDANGAFGPDDAPEKLKRLSDFQIHSIEQPIKPRQWEQMAELCERSPVPIALDEELIGLRDEQIPSMLEIIKPAYIILKPSLVGGLERSDLFIAEALKRNIGWWATSALESNIGLNVIAQWTAVSGNEMPQGLGTGQLYINNIPSPLTVSGGAIYYDKQKAWDLSIIK
jgi:o-succinylbenzoate synthase